jgi:DNA-directed RNA polymerase, mitochondrial
MGAEVRLYVPCIWMIRDDVRSSKTIQAINPAPSYTSAHNLEREHQMTTTTNANYSAHQARLEAQYELETEGVNMGIKRYREILAKDGVGELPPGLKLIKHTLGTMIAALAEWKKEASAGTARRSAGVYKFLNQVDDEALAWITAQSAISTLHDSPGLGRLATAITLSIEGTLTLDKIIKEQPKLASKVSQKVKKMGSDRNKLVFIRKGAAMVGVDVIQWDDSTRVRVGTLLLEMFAQATGIITIETIKVGAKSSTHVRATELCTKWLEESNSRCELMTPTRMPMLVPPTDWKSPFHGGYLSKALREPLIKTRSKQLLSELREWEMPRVYDAVNALQATAWAINEPVYKAINELWETGSEVGGLPNRLEEQLPGKSWEEGEIPDAETLHQWKVRAAACHERIHKSKGKRKQASQKLWIAERMLGLGNVFHYVYNLDWRGRMYPVGASLTPQGDDVSKALLCFHKAEKLGEAGAYWLAVHGANSYGVDKVSFDERVRWVQDNEANILASAADPIGMRHFWAEEDEEGKCTIEAPFGFLAFCFEYAALDAWVAAGNAQEDFESRLPIAFDGTCNGLQNFSAMLLDEEGGAATGLVPSNKPTDIYTAVKEATQRIIDRDAYDTFCEDRIGARKALAAKGNKPARDAYAGTLKRVVAQRWVGRMTRGLAKRNTMTSPYGVTRRGMHDQIYKELMKALPKGDKPTTLSEDAQYISECNHQAIGQVVVAARKAMDWLREVARVAASNKLPVRWETPMGLLVVQDYRIDIGETADFTVLGRRFNVLLQRTGDKLNSIKQAGGISPNFVHSLDAAHLMATVLFCEEDGMRDFAMVHDSYGCHAGKAELLQKNLRDAFVALYSNPVLENFRTGILEQLPEELHELIPPVPPMGTLDLELVKQSDYFFA